MNEKTKKEGYTDQLNQELLGTLGEKASSEQISACLLYTSDAADE